MIKHIPDIINFAKKMKSDRLSAYAAQSSLFIFLSFMPFLMLLMTLIRNSALSEEALLEFASTFASPISLTTIKALIEQLYSMDNGGFFLFSLISLLWASGKGFLSLIEGLNSVFDIEEHRGYIRLRLYSIIYTLVFVIVILICLAVFILGSELMNILHYYVPVIAEVIARIMTIRSLVSFILFTVLFTFLYITIPYRHTTIKRQLPGAAFASFCWVSFSYIFSLYVRFSKNLSLLYGGLTSLIMIILWLYICMYIFLIGAEINRFNELKEISCHTC